MTRSTAALLGLICWGAGLLALALWAARRTHNANDFFLGSRRLGIWFVALSHTANATPVWLLLAISGAAFVWGLSAIWIWIAVICGYALNGFYVAPRLRLLSAGQGSITVVQVLSADAGDRMQPLIVRSAALILSIAMLLEIGAVLQVTGTAFADGFGFDATTCCISAVIAVVIFTLVGGLWATSAGDIAQVIILLAVSLFMPLLALVAAGGLEQLQIGFAALGPATTDWFGGRSGVVAIAFVVGVSGFGFDIPGQPHAVIRFMAARDEATLRAARWISLLLIAVLLGALLLCGWCASVLYAGLGKPEQALFAIGERILPGWMSAIITTAALCTMLTSIGNRLLIVASSLSADVKRATSPLSFAWARVVLVLFAILALCFALYASGSLLDQTLFAFSALGAAFGPLLLVRLTGKRVRPGSTLGAMWAGFILTWLFHVLPDAPGDFLERVLPFVAALGIALSGGERRRNPDRADRSQETVHDRVPI